MDSMSIQTALAVSQAILEQIVIAVIQISFLYKVPSHVLIILKPYRIAWNTQIGQLVVVVQLNTLEINAKLVILDMALPVWFHYLVLIA